MTVSPHVGGSGKRTVMRLGRLRTAAPAASSSRAIRFSTLCAIAAFVAFAPKRSTTVCRRSISLACSIAFFASRCLVVGPRPLVLAVGAVVLDDRRRRRSSVARSRCSTRVIASSSSSRSWLITSSAPWYWRRKPSSQVLASTSRWLVGSSRQQHVGAGEQDAGELDASALAARQRADRLVEPVESGMPRPAAIARASLSAA